MKNINKLFVVKGQFPEDTETVYKEHEYNEMVDKIRLAEGSIKLLPTGPVTEEVTSEKEDELKAVITKTHATLSELRKVLDRQEERSGLSDSVTRTLYKSIVEDITDWYY